MGDPEERAAVADEGLNPIPTGGVGDLPSRPSWTQCMVSIPSPPAGWVTDPNHDGVDQWMVSIPSPPAGWVTIRSWLLTACRTGLNPIPTGGVGDRPTPMTPRGKQRLNPIPTGGVGDQYNPLTVYGNNVSIPSPPAGWVTTSDKWLVQAVWSQSHPHRRGG